MRHRARRSPTLTHRHFEPPGRFVARSPLVLGGAARPRPPNPLRRFFSRSASKHAPAAKRSLICGMYPGCCVRYNSPYRGRARPHIPPPWRSARLFLARYHLMYKVGMCALQRGRREDGHGHWRRAPWAAKAFREAVEARSSPKGRGLRPGPTSSPYTPECVEEAFSEVRG
jgi:hypothetical protein